MFNKQVEPEDKKNLAIQEICKEITVTILERNELLSFLIKKNQYAINRYAEIKGKLDLNWNIVDDWIEGGAKKDSIKFKFRSSNELINFSNRIEQLFLKGKTIQESFNSIELSGWDNSDYFCSESGKSVKKNNKDEIHEAICDLKEKLDGFGQNSNLLLICNPNIFKKEKKEQINEDIGIGEDQWIGIKDEACICLLNYDELKPPFKFFETLFLTFPDRGGLIDECFPPKYRFIVCLQGALEIKNKEAIQWFKLIQ